MLAVLELLQTHGRLSGAELAARLAVDRRTVRRHIALLEEIGIPITAERGVHGGYELVPGYKLPPMMFTYDEALALALGLAAVRGLGLSDATVAIAGARAKLERVMPANVKSHMRSVGGSVAIAGVSRSTAGVDGLISALSLAAHGRLGVRMRYRAAGGDESERDFDPYGLAFRNGRWYTVGHCHLRQGLRSFRMDRVVSVVPQARPFERPGEFDVMAHLAVSMATLRRKHAIEVLLETDLESARGGLFEAMGVLEPRGEAVLLRSQADDLDWFARELARLPWPFEVLGPVELREAVMEHARAMLARQASTSSERPPRRPFTSEPKR